LVQAEPQKLVEAILLFQALEYRQLHLLAAAEAQPIKMLVILAVLVVAVTM
jgi:hypothetical protein